MIEGTLERVNATERKARIVVAREAVDKAFDNARFEIQKLKMRPLGEKQLGLDPRATEENATATRATRQIAETQCRAFVDEHGLRLIANPKIEVKELAVEGEEFAFEATLSVVPEYLLKDHANLVVEVPKDIVATDEDIDARLGEVRSRSAQETKKSTAPIGSGDVVRVSFENFLDGEAYEGNVVHGYNYEMGSLELPAAFEEGLLGLVQGDDKTIDFVVPEDFPNEEIAGRRARFDVHVDEVTSRVLPEVDDAFAQGFGYEDLAAWREKLRVSISQEKEGIYEMNCEKRAREELADRLDGEPDSAMVKLQTERMLQAFRQELSGQGIQFEEYCSMLNLTEDQIKQNMEEEAGQMLRENLALESLFRELGQEIGEDDLQTTLSQMALETGASAFGPLGELSFDQKGALREMTMHRLATEWLMNNASFVEPVE